MWTVYDSTIDANVTALPARTRRRPVWIPVEDRAERKSRHLDHLADLYLAGDAFTRGFLDETLAHVR